MGWYPTGHPSSFGALPIIFGSALVTLGSVIVAVPLGISAAVCLSDILSFRLRQVAKPIIEVLAAIPSVAYGFFALVVLAPMLQNQGGLVLSIGFWLVSAPIAVIVIFLLSDLASSRIPERARTAGRFLGGLLLALLSFWILKTIGFRISALQISSGTNALNVSLILGIMAVPTIVSVSEDALQAVGRELREASYALGATRAETIMRVVVPAAKNGITAAVILGVMRAMGETMVVWMASGNSPQIPKPWYNFLKPVRTLTATIAGEMGETDQSFGSAHYHSLFVMALFLLVISFGMNYVSERIITRSKRIRE
jgi:phosphate transport system permease protein